MSEDLREDINKLCNMFDSLEKDNALKPSATIDINYQFIRRIKYDFDRLEQENKELKEDLEYVLNQVLGAFERNDCIDWNFTDIREKYNFKGDK